jgi:4-amino-4-deoxy-L-arabinose transferase-like glycosyltransferase
MRIATGCGLALGLAVSGYAHTGNGFQTGPLVALALAVSILGAAASGLLLLIGKRGHRLAAVGAFCAAMLVALVVVPIVWPYPSSQPPTSLERDRPGAQK